MTKYAEVINCDDWLAGYPQNPFERVRYAMAIISRALANIDATSISPTNPIAICNGNSSLQRYLWAAILVFGSQVTTKKLNYHSISLNPPLFDIRDEFNYIGSKECGILWSFSPSSYYESIFKLHLQPDMLEISETASLYDGICGKLSFEEQKKQWQYDEFFLKKSGYSIDEIKMHRQQRRLHLHLVQLIDLLCDYRKVVSLNSDGWSVYFKYSYSAANKYQAIDKVLVFLGEGVVPVFNRYDIAILHENKAIKAWQKKTGIMIDACFPTTLASYVVPNSERFKSILVNYYENDKTIFNDLLNYPNAKYANSLPSECEPLFDSNKVLSIDEIDSLLGLETLTANQLIVMANMCQDHHSDSGRTLLCYQKASDLNSPDAAFYLGQLYEVDDDNRPKDTELAFHYYLKATKLGHQDALAPLERLTEETSAKNQLLVSQLYENVLNNHEKAEYWRRNATEILQYDF